MGVEVLFGVGCGICSLEECGIVVVVNSDDDDADEDDGDDDDE